MREMKFWQPAGQRIFPFTPHTTAFWNLPNETDNFLFASYYGQKSEMPNAGAKKYSFHLLLQSEQGKMAGNGAGQQKSSKSFSDLLLSLAASVAAGIQFWKLISYWYDKRRVIALCFQKETISPWIYPTKYAIAILIAMQHIHSISAITFFPVILFTDLP